MSLIESTSEPVPDSGGGLVRLRGALAYDGTGYHGWARQPNLPTIQEEVELALATVLRVRHVDTVVAGRTDAGVHAVGQVVHLDAPVERWAAIGAERLRRGVNAVLPPDIRVRLIEAVPMEFDARFAALWRRYRYTVSDHPGGADPLQRRQVLWIPRRLDVQSMDDATRVLVGEHDFGAFCKPRHGAGTVRRISECTWSRDPTDESLVRLCVRADAFCHSMVRSIVGASLLVGRGAREPEWVGRVLEAGTRTEGVPVAPPLGLVLMEVGYPSEAEYSARTAITKTRRPAPGHAATVGTDQRQ